MKTVVVSIHTNKDLAHPVGMKPNAREFGVPAPRWTYYKMGAVEGKCTPTRPSQWVYYDRYPRRGELGQKALTPSLEELPIIGDRVHFPNHELTNPNNIDTYKMSVPSSTATLSPKSTVLSRQALLPLPPLC
jgi:hypothetical protein